MKCFEGCSLFKAASVNMKTRVNTRVIPPFYHLQLQQHRGVELEVSIHSRPAKAVHNKQFRPKANKQ